MTLGEALTGVPKDIVDALEAEMTGLLHRFSRRDWGPAELNGGRLSEAILRYVEWRSTGAFTPFGHQLDRLRLCRQAQQNTSLDDSLRFHLPGAAQLILDFRNKRDVAHLSSVVDVNEMDAQLIVRVGSWLVAEVVRLESSLAARDIQKLIDSLTVKHVPTVEVFDGEVVVVAPHLSASDRVLVRLYFGYPAATELATLRSAVKYGNVTRFRSIVEALDRQGLVHLTGTAVHLTHLGAAAAEALLA